MDRDAMDRALKEVQRGWDSLGAFARTQSGEVMRPMMALMGMLVDDLTQAKQEREQLAMALAVANDAIRALSEQVGICEDCAPPPTAEQAVNIAKQATGQGIYGRVCPSMRGLPDPQNPPLGGI